MKTEFESFSDFLSYADRIAPIVANDSGHYVGNSRKRESRGGWYGTSDFSETMKLARDGWAEGREAVEAAIVHFSSVIGSKARRTVLAHEVAGSSPDVAAFLCGDPENMFAREYIETETVGKIIRLVVNGTASAGIDSKEIIKRGALIVALVDSLEMSGFSVEVILTFHGKDAGVSTEQIITVKSAGDPVEIDRLAFCIAHPSCFRRLGFSCWEHDPLYMAKHYRSGYGRCAESSDKGDIYIPSSDLTRITDGEASRWVRDHLAPLGITFDE